MLQSEIQGAPQDHTMFGKLGLDLIFPTSGTFILPPGISPYPQLSYPPKRSTSGSPAGPPHFPWAGHLFLPASLGTTHLGLRLLLNFADSPLSPIS